jgi:hypothetical protein
MVKLVDITHKTLEEKINRKRFKKFYQKIDSVVFSYDFWKSSADKNYKNLCSKMSEMKKDEFHIEAKYRDYSSLGGKPRVFLDIIDIKRNGNIRVADMKFLDLAKK